MAKFSYLTKRAGSDRWYNKRDVPPNLRSEGRPNQIWRSLKTPDRKHHEKVYSKMHAEVELQFEAWVKEDIRPMLSDTAGADLGCELGLPANSTV